MNKIVLALSALLVGQNALAAGYEKSIPFGGEAAGHAGIATPYMQGSQALFYNPAGLVTEKAGQKDISFNISPTQAKFKAPLARTDTSAATSNDKMVFPFALMYGNTLSDTLGIGAGVYIAGGTNVEYDSAAAPGQKAKSDISIMEIALGAGYKVMDNLKLGLTWRVGMAEAKTSSPGASQTDWTGKNSNYMGFKLGAQYKLSQDTDLGFSYRSEMNYKLKGTRSGAVNDEFTMGTTFPAAWTIGVAHKCTEEWKLMAEYVFTEYSKVDNLATESSLLGNSPVLMKWKDQSNVRLGAEYGGLGMPLRFGYIWTSQVTNADYHSATAIPPGMAHTLTLGTGYAMDALRFDGGFEYTMASGTSNGATVKSELTSYALHLGAAYTF